MKEEIENLSESDKKLCQMLASLEKVEAPTDFDFHLKARIAKADPRSFQKSYARRFGYILPATGLAAVLTFAGLYGNFSGIGGNSTVDAGVFPSTVQQVAPQTSQTQEVASSSANSDSNSFNASTSAPQVQRTPSFKPEIAFDEKGSKQKNQPRDAKGNLVRPKEGVKEDAYTEAPDIKPPGLNDKNKTLIPESQLEDKDLSAQEMFKVLGIETTLVKGALRVKSLSPNSSANRSDLKPDDIIESVNGQRISNGTIRGKKIEVKKLTVKRGTDTVEINLETVPKP